MIMHCNDLSLSIRLKSLDFQISEAIRSMGRGARVELRADRFITIDTSGGSFLV